jgi:hypothetical protein
MGKPHPGNGHPARRGFLDNPRRDGVIELLRVGRRKSATASIALRRRAKVHGATPATGLKVELFFAMTAIDCVRRIEVMAEEAQ